MAGPHQKIIQFIFLVRKCASHKLCALCDQCKLAQAHRNASGAVCNTLSCHKILKITQKQLIFSFLLSFIFSAFAQTFIAYCLRQEISFHFTFQQKLIK
jgi:hypothetical protein